MLLFEKHVGFELENVVFARLYCCAYQINRLCLLNGQLESQTVSYPCLQLPYNVDTFLEGLEVKKSYPLVNTKSQMSKMSKEIY